MNASYWLKEKCRERRKTHDNKKRKIKKLQFVRTPILGTAHQRVLLPFYSEDNSWRAITNKL
jgi:hypothetical protein